MFKRNKKQKQTSLLGVDISNDIIKLIELSRLEEGLCVISCIKHVRKKNNSLVDELKHILDKVGGKGKAAAILLPDTVATTQKIALDVSLKEKDILTWIHNKASDHFNLPSNELAVDYKKGQKTGFKRQEIYWAAAKKETVDQHVKVMNEAGVEIKTVETSPFVLRRGHLPIISKQRRLDQAVGIAYFNGNTLLFVVVKAGYIIYNRTKPYQALRTEAAILKRMLDMFLLSFPAEKITHIFLAGKVNSLEEIQRSVPVPISLSSWLDCFVANNIKCDMQSYPSETLLLAFGLAMRMSDEH